MAVAKDERVEIYKGFPFMETWDFKNNDDSSVDLSGSVYTAQYSNIHEENSEYTDIGTVTLDESVTGRLLLDLTSEETDLFKQPDYEENLQDNETCSRILILRNGYPFLAIEVAVIE